MDPLETTLTVKFPCGCELRLSIMGDGTELMHKREITRCVNHKPTDVYEGAAGAIDDLFAMVRQIT